MSHKKQPWYPPPSLPHTGVESHAHLNSRRFTADLDAVLARAKDAGVAQLGQVFLGPAAYDAGKDLFPSRPEHPEVFFLLGIHPSEAHEFTPEDVDRMRDIIGADPRIKAVGEMGLDYYWKECPPDVQKDMFVRQLKLAREMSLPVAIHSREATEDTFALLESQGFTGYPVLWHCFGGDAAMAQRVVAAGWHLSIPGPITFPANTALRDAVARAPLERLMVETDCPYLAPMPLRGKRNEPAYLGYTIDAMAKARGMDTAELWTICGNNARSFFRL